MADEERNEQNEERDEEERSEEQDDDGDESQEASGSSGDDGDDDDGDTSDDTSSDDDDEGDDDGDREASDEDGPKVSDVMSSDPASVSPGDSIEDAAKKMKEADTGALLVVDGDELKGVVTDRDIVVNAVAEGNSDAKVEDVASTDTTTIEPDSTLSDAIDKMREAKVRRLPVVEGDKPVGIVSLGDLAIEADDDSALKEISQAEPNA